MKKINIISHWEKHTKLVHGFSTKILGNISFRTDEREIVKKRREILTKELGIDWDSILILPLSHSNHVLSLPKGSLLLKDVSGVYSTGGHIFQTNLKPIHINQEWQSGIDAVVTDMPGLFPIIMSADCAAVGLFDPVRNIVALAHVGLIGAINRIVEKTIQCMVDEYKSNPNNIEVVIFPSIRKCHYDLRVSGAWKIIKNDSLVYYGESDQIFANSMFDLQELIKRQFLISGVLIKNIYDVELCTVCNQNMFFSNLAAGSLEHKKIEGRFASIIGVKK